MTLAVIWKAVLIAVCAALSVLAYFALGSTLDGILDGGHGFTSDAAVGTLGAALFGSFTIGLPVALLTFLLSWRHLAQSPATLAMVAVLAGIMMILTSYVIGDEMGVLVLGLPAFVAALTYGILGWFWILKPLRPTLKSPPPEKEIG
ncbi:MAG: hypothetical protein AAGH60_15330 [Pseudomonadota bacterium]